MNDDKNLDQRSESNEIEKRREAIKKLGKYAVYIAPFTVTAFSSKAASVSGPRPKPLKH